MPTATVRITSSRDLARLAAVIREEDARFPAELRQRLARVLRPYVAELKRNARRIPVHGSKHTGLRRRVAAGVFGQVRTTRSPGISFRTRMADPSEAVIPRGMDRQAGWRHPVYGDTNTWVQQTTGGSWFRQPLADKHDQIKRDLRDEMQDMVDRIDRAG